MPTRNEYIYLKGKAKWCRPHVPDPWGNYKTNLYPNLESLDKVRKLKEVMPDGTLGIKNTIGMDEDGEYIILKRPTEKTYNGKVSGFAPPDVVDGSKTLPDGTNPPLRDTNIGNGSDVTCKVVVYKHNIPGSRQGGPKGRAMRWEAMRVDNLVPFDGKKDFSSDEEQNLQGLSEQSPGF